MGGPGAHLFPRQNQNWPFQRYWDHCVFPCPFCCSTGVYMVYDPDSYLFILLSAVICTFDDIPNVMLYYVVFMIHDL